jgi:hypothetical protein
MLPSKASSTAGGSGGEADPPAMVLDWKTCGLTCRHKAALRGTPDLPTKPAKTRDRTAEGSRRHVADTFAA